MRLDVLSETEQRVWTPGVDLQAVLTPGDQPRGDHRPDLLPRPQQRRPPDHHHDVDGGPGGARRRAGRRRSCFPSPIQLGPPSIAHPVRVPDASLRDVAVFVQDEWRVRPELSVDRRPARRLLQPEQRGDARLLRGVGRRRRGAGDRSGDAARPERRDGGAQGAHRRHRPGGESRPAASTRSSASAAATAIRTSKSCCLPDRRPPAASRPTST